MAGLTFLQGSELFSFSGTHCLRNDYVYNECHACIDLCPEDAFHLVRNKLTLFENECIACSACLGVCPTEALSMKSFDPNNYVRTFNTRENSTISCKADVSCLGSFDAHHYITLALEHESEITCDLAHCAECNLNKEKKVEAFIRSEIDKSNAFFKTTTLEKKLLISEEIVEIVEGKELSVAEEVPQKRLLFKKAFVEEKPTEDIVSLTLKNREKTTTQVPFKVKKMQEVLQKHIPFLSVTKFDEPSELFFNKEISFSNCTNCGDCTQFCPTGSLFNSDDKLGIVFTPSKCINCDICEHICKTNAISKVESYDLIEIAYERSRELVRYEMVMCVDCRCPYPYRGGDPICDRCVSFKTQMPNMFVMAKDT